MKGSFAKAARAVLNHLPKRAIALGVSLSAVGILSAGCVGPIPPHAMFNNPTFHDAAPRPYNVYPYRNSYPYYNGGSHYHLDIRAPRHHYHPHHNPRPRYHHYQLSL